MTNRLLRILGSVLNRFLNPLGLHLSKLPVPRPGSVDMGSALQRLQQHHVPINSVIDVGASDGSWSRMMKTVYPNAQYLLIEANSVHQEKLDEYIASNPNTTYTLAVASDTEGAVYFDASDPLGGIASHQPTKSATTTLPCVSIDGEIKRLKFKGPYLVKLDTHGFEVPIFEGAIEVLKDTNLIVVETYNFNLTGDSLTFWELCSYLEQHGFRPIDILDPLFRPKDQLFWQMDIIFGRKSMQGFKSVSYG